LGFRLPLSLPALFIGEPLELRQLGRHLGCLFGEARNLGFDLIEAIRLGRRSLLGFNAQEGSAFHFQAGNLGVDVGSILSSVFDISRHCVHCSKKKKALGAARGDTQGQPRAFNGIRVVNFMIARPKHSVRRYIRLMIEKA
jgi:hypothetical protein